MSSWNKDDVITVGKTKWRIWRSWKSHGSKNLVTKEGSKGQKLYELNATEIDPGCCLEVREVYGGSGDWMGKPAVAKGCSVNGAGLWSGRTQRRRRKR